MSRSTLCAEKGTSQVGETDQEHQAERKPDERLEQRLATERPVPAACHLPGDLRTRPGLCYSSGRVLDDRLRHLAGFL